MTIDKRLYVSIAPLRALITLAHAYLFPIGIFPYTGSTKAFILPAGRRTWPRNSYPNWLWLYATQRGRDMMKPTPTMLAQKGMLSVCRYIKGDEKVLIPPNFGRYAGQKQPLGRLIIPKQFRTGSQ